MFEAGELGTGLQASRTLIPHRVKDVPLRVMNLMDTEVRLGMGTAMAELQPVEVLGQPACPDVNRAQGECIEELMDDVDAAVIGAERVQLRKLLQVFGGILSVNEYDMGQTGITKHRIDTGTHPPIRQPLRRYPLPHLQAIKEQTELMLQQGIIEPAVSGWTSNVVLVRKKDGSLRFFIDYRRVNEGTQKDAYPLPRIDTCLNAMNGARWFSTFDLRSGYHQVLMDEESADKTTFITREGSFRFRVMAFGLTGRRPRSNG